MKAANFSRRNPGGKNMKSIVAVATTGLLLAANSAQAQTSNDIVGCWRVHTLEIERPDAKLEPFGPNPVIQLIFMPDGHMSNISMRPDLPADYQQTDGGPTITILAYFGTYSLQGKTLTINTANGGSSRPDWRNKTLTRNVEVSKDQLLFTDNPVIGTVVRGFAKRC
jgi:hypothetical protein